MKALDFTKKKSKLVDKLVKLGFHYQSTDKEPASLRGPSRLITTWANIKNGVTLQIIDTHDIHYDENDVLLTTPRKYVRITDDCTNISVTMSIEEFMELEQITDSLGHTFPRLGNIQRNDFQIQRNDLIESLRKYVE